MSEAVNRSDVTAVLAEYGALRTEIITRITIQSTAVGSGATAIGVVAGIALGRPEGSGILVLIPLIAATALMIFTFEGLRVAAISLYLRERQLPYLRGCLGPDLPSWEETSFEDYRRSHGWRMVSDVPIDLGSLLASVGAAVYAVGSPAWLRILSVVLIAIVVVGRQVAIIRARRAAPSRRGTRTAAQGSSVN